jgi:hypothetical protein
MQRTISQEVHLFHLFFTKSYLEGVRKWTGDVLVSRGKNNLVMNELLAYVWLELGMSLVKYNSIRSYWASGAFLGHETFRETMYKNRFGEIRSCVRFEAKELYDPVNANNDPLWFAQSLLDNFIRRSAELAVPVGISALDENTCATKARTRAKTYSPNKPAKYGIRFYAVVGHKYCYLTSMFDNRTGNGTGVEGVHDYHLLFKQLRTPYYTKIANDNST